MPEANAKEFTVEGWFRTGDVRRFVADGAFSEGVVAVVVAQRGDRLNAEQLTQPLKSQIMAFRVPKRLFVLEAFAEVFDAV